MDSCPKCGKEIKVYDQFWEVEIHNSNNSEFDYECEHCGIVLFVEVEASPIFHIREKTEK